MTAGPGLVARVRYRLRPSVLVERLPEIGYRPQHPPRVGLAGFFGAGNYGDELFLAAFREHLGAALELRTLTDLSGGRPSAGRLRAAVGEVDAIVIGGGDLLMPWYVNQLYWRRRYLRRPVFVVGVGVPTSRPAVPAVLRAYGRFLAHPNVRLIALRDPESAAWVEEHVAPGRPVVVVPDLACALTLPTVERPSGPPVFGVVTRARARADAVEMARRLCERARERGYRIRQIVLGTGRVRIADEQVLGDLDVPDREIVSTDDLRAITRAILECTALASMKFHGTVVATMAGIPAVSVSLSDKHRVFLRRTGREAFVWDPGDPGYARIVDRLEEPLDSALVAPLRAEATALLADLRERLLAL